MTEVKQCPMCHRVFSQPTEVVYLDNVLMHCPHCGYKQYITKDNHTVEADDGTPGTPKD
jgi:uncharacterized Zn finger protein